jgi:aldehyde:ferredoxin oxidoreductase
MVIVEKALIATENTSILAQKTFSIVEFENGYANRTLYVNLSSNSIEYKHVSEEMKQKFIGGKGFDLWLMWNSLPKDRIVNWDDPENEICIGNGPLGGSTLIPGSGKCIVTTISPLTGIPVDSNVGGYFGGYLKQAGFDAFEIQGKANTQVIIVIDVPTQSITIETAPESLPQYAHLLTQVLTEKYARDQEKTTVSVATAGPGAKNSRWGVLNFSWYAQRRKWASYKQAGRGGIGTVFADKNILAIVVRAPKLLKSINPAKPEILKEISALHRKEILENDPKQNEVRAVGTAHLPDIMNEYDLFPTENYRFGKHHTLKSEEIAYHRDAWRPFFTETGKGYDGCWLGCPLNCSHWVGNHVALTGPFKGQKVFVDGPEYETIASCGSNWGVWDIHWVLEANFYCDLYGLDTISAGTGIAFVMECFEAGILNEKITGGLILKFGNAEAGMELIHQMGRGEGFGLIVGQGIAKMKQIFTEKYGADPKFLQDIGMEHKGLEFSMYMTKESLAQQGGYGLTLKGPQHDEAWLIFEDMVRNTIPTFPDKAAALCWFPYWRTWFGLNGLCKILWNDVTPMDNKNIPVKDEHGNLLRARIPAHVDWYSKYYEGMTGKAVQPDDLIEDSRRVYNFQRIFNIRQGKGLRAHDDNYPYRGMGPVTEVEYLSRADRYDKQLREILQVDPNGKSVAEKIALLREFRESQYSKLQDAVYEKRGWTNTGCPTIETVKSLGIDFPDVLKVIEKYQ